MPERESEPQRHQLLIVGIDDYTSAASPLGGCVNDATAIAGLLLANGATQEEVEAGLFLAPREARSLPLRYRAPTRENLLARLDELAACSESGDHVWIYYSGHGAQRGYPDPRTGAVFEALVPVDFRVENGKLLYDFELAQRLAAICRKTDSVTVILDCCHSASATRSLQVSLSAAGASPGADRFLELSEPQQRVMPPIPASQAEACGIAGLASGAERQPTVVSACHSDEKARESAVTGELRGIFTAAFLELLAQTKARGAPLATLRWADIWQELRALVRQRNPAQQPWLGGSLGRACLGGRSTPYDPGLAIRKNANTGAYELEAGRLIGLGKGSLIGVYAADPPLFAALGTRPDTDARLTTLRVTQVELLTAAALPVEGAKPLSELPRGARARLLTTELALSLSDEFAARLEAPALLQAAEQRGLHITLTDPREAELQVCLLPNGSCALGDRANPPQATSNGAYPLAVLEQAQSYPASALRRYLVEAFLHYAHYAQPLRMVRLAKELAGDRQLLPSGVLEVELVQCSDLSPSDCLALNEDPARRVPMVDRGRDRYPMRVTAFEAGPLTHSPDRFALWFRNNTPLPLFVSVLDCNCEGQIEELFVNEQIPTSPAGKLIWWKGTPGDAFELRLMHPRRAAIERLIVIAATIKGAHGIDSLKQSATLQEAMGLDTRGFETGTRPLPGSQTVTRPFVAWTARELTLELKLA